MRTLKDRLAPPSSNPYVPGALKDLSISRIIFHLGHPRPRTRRLRSQRKARHLRLARRPRQLHDRPRLRLRRPHRPAKFEKFWPADLHLVGKEIIRFHCVYWPAFLLAAGLPLPKAITAHGWLLFDNSKMSKSKGNIVRTETILDAFGTLCPALRHPTPPIPSS